MEFELKQIKELMAAMERSGATKFQLKLGENELVVERAPEPAAPMTLAHAAHFPLQHHPFPPPPHHLFQAEAAPVAAVEKAPQPVQEDEGLFVTAPMVGTLYHASAPDEPAFVKVGDRIEEGTVVAIIEAMKVMNEVKAGVSGVVAEILAPNGQPVEYGTKLFRIKTS